MENTKDKVRIPFNQIGSLISAYRDIKTIQRLLDPKLFGKDIILITRNESDITHVCSENTTRQIIRLLIEEMNTIAETNNIEI